MQKKRAIIVCENFKREVEFVLNQRGIPNLIVASFKSSCGLGLSESDINTDLLVNLKECDQIDLICSASCVNVKNALQQHQNLNYIKLNNCFELVFSKVTVEHLIRQGAHLLTPTWLRNWRQYVELWGFTDYNQIHSFFSSFCKRLVLLDTLIDDSIIQDLVEFAEFVGLEYEVIPVGVEKIEDFIEKIRLKDRLETEQALSSDLLNEAYNRVSDFAMLSELNKKLTAATSEKDAIDKVFHFMTLLFAPRELFLVEIREGQPGQVRCHGKAQPKQELITEVSEGCLMRPYLTLKKGFAIRIKYQNEVLCILVVNKIRIPQYIDRYLDLLLRISEIFGLTLSNARRMDQIIESEAWFRSSFDFAGVGMGITDLAGNYLRVNNAFCIFTGYTERELLRLNMQDITYAEDLEVNFEMQNALLEANLQSVEIEKRYIHKSGNMVWGLVNISIIRDGFGAPQYVIGQIQDITKRKNIESQLRRVNELNKKMFLNAPIGIFSFDHEGNVQMTNSQYLQIFGHNILMNYFKAGPKKKLIDEILSEGHEVCIENETIQINPGEIKHLSIKGVPLFEENKIIGGLAIVEDVSDRVAAVSAIRKSNEELTRISQFKTEFLANMTHELRTPLTAILALTGEVLLKRQGPLNAKQEEYLTSVHESAERLLTLIDDLLEFSKIESGRISLNFSEVSVGTVTKEVISSLAPLANQKFIKLVTDIKDSINIIADSNKVRQVVTNLLGNAIKFSPPESEIEVKVFDQYTPEEGIILKVMDSGPGIPLEEHERIFDAFYQVNRGLNKRYKGTGLGLALVKKFMDLHLGKIEIESREKDSGAVFTAFWPAFPNLEEDLV